MLADGSTCSDSSSLERLRIIPRVCARCANAAPRDAGLDNEAAARGRHPSGAAPRRRGRARADRKVRRSAPLEALELPRATWLPEQASHVSPGVRLAIERAAARVRRFHEREKYASFELVDDGARVGMRVAPLARVGLYVPGGTARYPSTVVMTAVPAKVAGVREVVMTTPGPSPETLAAALEAGVDRVFVIGGARRRYRGARLWHTRLSRASTRSSAPQQRLRRGGQARRLRRRGHRLDRGADFGARRRRRRQRRPFLGRRRPARVQAEHDTLAVRTSWASLSAATSARRSPPRSTGRSSCSPGGRSPRRRCVTTARSSSSTASTRSCAS